MVLKLINKNTSKKEEELSVVTLNPLSNSFKEYKYRWVHEPYLTYYHTVEWRNVIAPQIAYVSGRDINDKTAYNLELKK